MSTVQDQLTDMLGQRESPIWHGYVNMLKMLKSQFKSERHWILEFLQNAEDAGAQRMEVRLEDNGLWVLNDGNPFSEADFKALCDVKSSKSPAQGHLGYLGLGFKSIFRIADSVSVYSGVYSFGFDRAHWEGTQHLAEWPWEVLPIERESVTIPEGYATAFHVSGSDPRLRDFHERLRDFLTGSDFPGEIILLLQNVGALVVRTEAGTWALTKEVKAEEILTQGEQADEEPIRVQQVSIHRTYDGQPEAETSAFLVIRTVVQVPPDIVSDRTTEEDARRAGVHRRDIGIVLGLDSEGAPTELQGRLAGVYSFLPLEGEQTGLPLGISADFIPDPGRDLVKYDLPWNRWLCHELADLFKSAMDALRTSEAWKFLPAKLLSILASSGDTQGNPGAEFWRDMLRAPIQETLRNGCYYPDRHGRLRTLKELVFVDRTLRNALGNQGTLVLERHLAKSLAHEDIEDTLGHVFSSPDERFSSSDVYYLLKEQGLMENLASEPQVLRELYELLGEYTGSQISYRLRGRDGRDVRLESAPFVLGVDGRFYPPSQVVAVPGLPAGEGLPPVVARFVEGFDTKEAEGGKVRLHPDVASSVSVSQLQRCGVETLDVGSLSKQMAAFVFGAARREDFDGIGWHYPDDAVEGTHYLVAQGESGHGVGRIIDEESIIKDPRYLFVPDSPLDWSKVARDGDLPGYSAVHPLYLDEARLERWVISQEKMLQFLREAGLHGFDPEHDRPLSEDASYAIAEAELRQRGHRPQRVQHRQNLGYDIECSQHCLAVFEVKSMGEPADVELEPSETQAAKERAGNYYLVCVYGLPDNPDCQVVPDPARIWEPVERARVRRDRWWSA